MTALVIYDSVRALLVALPGATALLPAATITLYSDGRDELLCSGPAGSPSGEAHARTSGKTQGVACHDRGGGRDGAEPSCAACRKRLQPEGPDSGRRRQGGGGGGGVLECAACHRRFHARCSERDGGPQRGRAAGGAAGRGASPPGGQGQDPQRGGGGDVDVDAPWFHSAECHKVHVALQRVCRSGAWPCGGAGATVWGGAWGAGAAPRSPPAASLGAAPMCSRPGPHTGAHEGPGCSPGVSQGCGAGGASGSHERGSAGGGAGSGAGDEAPALAVRLYDCRGGGPAAAAGLRRAHGVLRCAFGYGLADYRQWDYAAVLTRGPRAVSALTLDVYGADAAELCLAATAPGERRRGHCGALVAEVGRALAAAGVRRLLVAVDDDDADSWEVWRRGGLGFAPLAEAELRGLARSGLGQFEPAAAAGTRFLARPLGPPGSA